MTVQGSVRPCTPASKSADMDRLDSVRITHMVCWVFSCCALVLAVMLRVFYKATLQTEIGTLPYWLILLPLLGVGLGAFALCPYLLGWSELDSSKDLLMVWASSMIQIVIAMYAYAGAWMVLFPGHYSRLWAVPLFCPVLILLLIVVRREARTLS